MEDGGLFYIKENEVVGDIIYLENKGCISSNNKIESSFPIFIKITSLGIDKAEEIINAFIEHLHMDTESDINVLYKTLMNLNSNDKLKSIQWIINVKKPETFSNFSKTHNFFKS